MLSIRREITLAMKHGKVPPTLRETTRLIQPSVSSNKSPSQREADSSSWERQPKDKVCALSRLEDTGKPMYNFFEADIIVHPPALVKSPPALCSLLGL